MYLIVPAGDSEVRHIGVPNVKAGSGSGVIVVDIHGLY